LGSSRVGGVQAYELAMQAWECVRGESQMWMIAHYAGRIVMPSDLDVLDATHPCGRKKEKALDVALPSPWTIFGL